MRARRWLFGHWEGISEQYGFEMVEGPVLEAEELFTRKAGEEIVDQLYNFEVGALAHTTGEFARTAGMLACAFGALACTVGARSSTVGPR